MRMSESLIVLEVSVPQIHHRMIVSEETFDAQAQNPGLGLAR